MIDYFEIIHLRRIQRNKVQWCCLFCKEYPNYVCLPHFPMNFTLLQTLPLLRKLDCLQVNKLSNFQAFSNTFFFYKMTAKDMVKIRRSCKLSNISYDRLWQNFETEKCVQAILKDLVNIMILYLMIKTLMIWLRSAAENDTFSTLKVSTFKLTIALKFQSSRCEATIKLV